MRKHLLKYCAKNPLPAILTLFIFIPFLSYSQSNSIKNIHCDTLAAQDTSGKTLSIKNFKSKYTILFFWSYECPHCINAQNDICKLSKLYDAKKLLFVGLCVDSNFNNWKNQIQLARTSYPQLNDGQGLKSRKLELLKITGTPTFVILNKQKEVIDIALTEDELIRKINNLWK